MFLLFCLVCRSVHAISCFIRKFYNFLSSSLKQNIHSSMSWSRWFSKDSVFVFLHI